MKLLHVVYECDLDEFRGGIQKIVYELGLAQAEQGDEVEIWTLGRERTLVLDSGLRIRYFPGDARWGAGKLHDGLNQEAKAFEVVHAHNTFLALNRYVAGLSCKGRKVFFHAHGALDPKLLNGWNTKALKKRIYANLIERNNYNAANGVIGNTPEECSQIALLGGRAPIYELPNGIGRALPASPLEKVRLRLKHRIGHDQTVILYIGRITHKKGIHYLIDSLSHVVRAIPDAVLLICGSREQFPDYVAGLDAQIARLNLQERIRWAGFLNERGKRAAFGLARVFVNPSYSEGMAMAVLESMSFGVPTLVTPGCYMNAAVENGAVTLVQQSGKDIAAAIIAIAKDANLEDQMRQKARDYSQQVHTWPAVAQNLRVIYQGSAKPWQPSE